MYNIALVQHIICKSVYVDHFEKQPSSLLIGGSMLEEAEASVSVLSVSPKLHNDVKNKSNDSIHGMFAAEHRLAHVLFLLGRVLNIERKSDCRWRSSAAGSIR